MSPSTPSPVLDSKCPSGPMSTRWDRHRFEMKLVNPANKRKFHVLVVGTGLAGASAAATLAELGYKVSAFFIHESPRRAHSIAAQGGINAAKNYQNDGDSVYRLFYDTVKGGDFRAREEPTSTAWPRSANDIIDQCVAQGVPFAREYGGLLANRSFGGAQVSRTFYARGQTGQQLLLGAYQALMPQGDRRGQERDHVHPREMLDLVVKVDGHARASSPATWSPAKIERSRGGRGLLATGGYGNVFYLSTNAAGVQRHGRLAGLQARGAGFANPCYTQIHPTCIPVMRRPPVEADADVRVAPQRRPRLGSQDRRAKSRARADIPEGERDYYLERIYPDVRQPQSPAMFPHRAGQAQSVDEGHTVVQALRSRGVYLDFARRDRSGWAKTTIRRRPLRQPVRDVPANHRRGLAVPDVPMKDLPGRATTRWAVCGSTTT